MHNYANTSLKIYYKMLGWETRAVRVGGVDQVVQRHCSEKQVCPCGLLGKDDRAEKWGTRRNMMDLYPALDTSMVGTEHCERAVQWSIHLNATALSIYRGDTFVSGHRRGAPLNNTKIHEPQDKQLSKSDVITGYLFVHMFTVMELGGKSIVSLKGGNAYRCSILDVTRSH